MVNDHMWPNAVIMIDHGCCFTLTYKVLLELRDSTTPSSIDFLKQNPGFI